MLTETELHYVCGLLYLRARRADVSLRAESAVLGEKVYDSAAEKTRDVDLVVATADQTTFIGVEVKDEKRPLDVIAVEQICQKFSDMPSINEHFLISASGFTNPARKKAKRHGLGCLDLVRGTPPRIREVDLSTLRSLTITTRKWMPSPKPHIRFNPDDDTPKEALAGFDDSTILRCGDNSAMSPIAFIDGIMNIAMSAIHDADTPQQLGHEQHSVRVTVDPHVTAKLPAGDLVIREAIATGIVELTKRPIPLHDSIYLKTDDGDVFAASLTFDVDGMLYGFQITADRQVSVFALPAVVRATRPIRHVVT